MPINVLKEQWLAVHRVYRRMISATMPRCVNICASSAVARRVERDWPFDKYERLFLRPDLLERLGVDLERIEQVCADGALRRRFENRLAWDVALRESITNVSPMCTFVLFNSYFLNIWVAFWLKPLEERSEWRWALVHCEQTLTI